MLQAELHTLGQPTNDLKLIITHVNKYSTAPRQSEQFIPIRLKYLQNPNNHHADLPPSFTAQVNTMTRPPDFTWSQYSQDVAQYARALNSVPRTTTVLSVNAPSPDRSHANRRLRDSSRWDKSSPPESISNRNDRRDGQQSPRDGDRGRRFSSRERSSGGDRPRDRSKSRDRSSSAGRDSRPQSSSSARNSARQESPRKFLPPEEYKKFKESLRSAHASVIK